jgi:hypothetical protein
MTTTITPSVFQPGDFYTRYATRLQVREKIMGGIPLNPKTIEAWLRSKAGVTVEEEVRMMLVRTLIERGAELDPAETDMGRIMAASDAIAAEKQTNGFKKNGQGLYIEGRQIKAMLKESINALFAGETVQENGKTKRAGWGPTKKGPKAFAAEHVFIDDERVLLGAPEPSGVEFVIGHIIGAGGPRSTIGYVEYVLQPALDFTVLCDPIAEEAITHERWRKIWLHAQENGVGAMRSQGHGRFNVVRWERLNGAAVS